MTKNTLKVESTEAESLCPLVIQTYESEPTIASRRWSVSKMLFALPEYLLNIVFSPIQRFVQRVIGLGNISPVMGEKTGIKTYAFKEGSFEKVDVIPNNSVVFIETKE